MPTRQQSFPGQDLALDRVFHALADPTRRQIVERLTRGPAAVSQLAEPFDMSLSAVMQHLQVLIEAELVTSEKSGRVRSCRLEPGRLRGAESWLGQQRTEWEHRLDRLDRALADTTAAFAETPALADTPVAPAEIPVAPTESPEGEQR